ncbi:MAG: hypothetical protein AB7V77_02160 [Candidatus Woesearchaeota archaeon]
MNSQELIIEIKNKLSKLLNYLDYNKFPLILIKKDGKSFGIFSHPTLGRFFIEDGKLMKSFFPNPGLNDYYELGKLAKQLTNLGIEYKIFISKNQQEKVLFSHVVEEKFYSS